MLRRGAVALGGKSLVNAGLAVEKVREHFSGFWICCPANGISEPAGDAAGTGWLDRSGRGQNKGGSDRRDENCLDGFHDGLQISGDMWQRHARPRVACHLVYHSVLPTPATQFINMP